MTAEVNIEEEIPLQLEGLDKVKDYGGYFKRAFNIYNNLNSIMSPKDIKVVMANKIRLEVQELLLVIMEQQNVIAHLYKDKEKEKEKVTYAEIVKPKEIKTRARSRSRSKVRNTVLIYPIDENKKAEETKEIIEREINIKEKEINIGTVRKIRKGGLAVDVDTKEDLEKIIREVEQNEKLKKEFTANMPKKKDPQIIVFNIKEVYEDSEIISKIKDQNRLEEGDEIKIRSKFKGKRGFNWVFQVSPQLYSKWAKSQKFYIGWNRYSFQDYLRPMICFKCSRYGHIGKYCRNAEVCLNCGKEGHKKESCEIMECINCKTYNDKFGSKLDVSHSVLDKKCKIYLKEIDRLASNIDYGPE